jgi:hypothetical protein
MKKSMLLYGTVLMIIAGVLTVLAQSSQWGGKGRVSVSPATAAPDSSVRIEYRVTESRGSGTADFHCEVTNPDGVIHMARKASSEWRDGEAHASFRYPDEFGGIDVPCTTSKKGTYQIQCYWYIEGYGVNGKTAAAGGAFVVQ